MNSDLLDEYCRLEFGHTDWEVFYEDGNAYITMYDKPRPDYVSENEEDEDGGWTAPQFKPAEEHYEGDTK